MDRDTLVKKLQKIFSDVFGEENLNINEGTTPGDIEAWDSLAQISILEAVQDEFNISFSIDEIMEMKSVGAILDAVLGKL
ncbi:MAG: acyl carrier protein [Lachnospiraceae bacterium]|nr:acyl carrier protein [Lachnospiraceae bacterium]